MKRLISLFLVVLMILSFAACGNSSKNEPNSSSPTGAANTSQTGPLFAQPTTISFMTMSHPSYPYDPNWVVWKYIKEATNVTLDVQAYGLTEWNDKLQLTMASGKLPDIIYMATESMNKFALDGPFADIVSNLSKLPNFSKWYNASQENKDELKSYTSADGKVYMFPLGVGDEVTMNKRGWLARLDILQKNNLKVPTTYDELYTVMKQLKTIYPDSYPFCDRQLITGYGMDLLAAQWGTRADCYYDFNKKEWRYGPIEDSFKALVQWLNKCYKEGLVPPDILTLETKGWTDYMSSSKSFFTVDYISRMDFFNLPMQTQNPDANLCYISPPKGSGANGQAIFAKTNYGGGGECITNGSNKENALKFEDWLYSDQAKQLLIWGKDGETYKVVDGNKKYITNDAKDVPEKMYGVRTFGLLQSGDSQNTALSYTKPCVDAMLTTSEKDSEKQFNPKWWMAFNKQEQDVQLSLEQTIKDSMQKNISKFITGEQGMDQWDNYVAEIKKLGIDKWLQTCKSAYDRVK